jgi:hypothetical protein
MSKTIAVFQLATLALKAAAESNICEVASGYVAATADGETHKSSATLGVKRATWLQEGGMLSDLAVRGNP